MSCCGVVVGKVLGAGSQLEPFWKETSDVVLEPLLQLGVTGSESMSLRLLVHFKVIHTGGGW